MLTSSRSPLACFPLKEFGAVAVGAAAKAHLGSKKKKKKKPLIRQRELIELLLMEGGAQYPLTGLSKDGGKGRKGRDGERVRGDWVGIWEEGGGDDEEENN